MNQLIEAWLDVHHELVHLLSPSSLEVESDGSRAKNTSTDHSVANEDHGCQTCGDHGGQNRDILLTFPGARLLQCGYQVSRGQDSNAATKYHRVMSPPRHYVTITKPRSTSLRSVITSFIFMQWVQSRAHQATKGGKRAYNVRRQQNDACYWT